MAVAAEKAESRSGLMRNRAFVAIWLGHTLSLLGDGFNTVALGLWILQTTGSAAAMGTVVAVRMIVGIALGAVAGTVVDRVNRRALMIAMDVARFVLILAAAWAVATPGTPFTLIVALSALTAAASAFFNPAFNASLVNIVGKDEVPRASSSMQVTNTLAQVAGPMLGGAVVGFWGGGAALTVDALTFLLSGLLILRAGYFPSPARDRRKSGSFWSDMKEGFQFVWAQPLIKTLVTTAPALNFFGNALGILFPVIAVKVWLVNSFQFGLLEAGIPFGFAVGAAVLMALSKKIRRRGLLILWGVVGMGFLSLLIVNMPTANLALILTPLMGVTAAVANVLIQIIVQSEVPPAVQGRVFGTMSSFMMAASPASMLAAGLLSDLFSPVLVASVACAAILLLSGLMFIMAPALRDYR